MAEAETKVVEIGRLRHAFVQELGGLFSADQRDALAERFQATLMARLGAIYPKFTLSSVFDPASRSIILLLEIPSDATVPAQLEHLIAGPMA